MSKGMIVNVNQFNYELESLPVELHMKCVTEIVNKLADRLGIEEEDEFVSLLDTLFKPIPNKSEMN